MATTSEPSIRQLRALEAVARTGSFTQAAAELGVSQPTVSNLIVSLERQTKCRFLRRDGNKIHTTPLFEKIRPQIRAVLALKSEVDQEIESRRDLKSGAFWVGYSTHQVAMAPIARFIQTYPTIQLTARAMATMDLLPLLHAGELDVAFVTSREPLAGLDCLPVAAFRIGLVVPRDGPLAGRPRLDWSEVAELPLIQREPNAGTRGIFEDAAAAAGTPVNTILGLGSWGSIVSLVRAGIGLGVGFDVELSARDKDLCFVPINDEKLNARQFLVAMPSMAETSMVQQFFEITREICA
ncbi:LysR family transcriptional regulator [Mameliella alba]|nr:LysR family transcriptional regulator [Mameliella alba]MBY6169822.1 LysR family transcriptional regulator [Mameliella alba]MBY6175201.1 LysR family transcriptional regulator [Mameliella alba]